MRGAITSPRNASAASETNSTAATAGATVATQLFLRAPERGGGILLAWLRTHNAQPTRRQPRERRRQRLALHWLGVLLARRRHHRMEDLWRRRGRRQTRQQSVGRVIALGARGALGAAREMARDLRAQWLG